MPERDPVNAPRLTREDFMEMPLERLAARTGLTPPDGGSPDEVLAWREQAWEDYQLDIENRDEWGTARQEEPPPED
ncbi:MAG: hypothetical protein U5K81_08645 [Trueperaceae bacterium]|nr:hypothetical protein [Trueperaceae bacterium]